MNNQLYNAILSMDAYNRGYNASIVVSGTQIGNYNIIAQSNTTPTSDEVLAGFYGIAYPALMEKT